MKLAVAMAALGLAHAKQFTVEEQMVRPRIAPARS